MSATTITAQQLERALSLRDLSDPAQGRHAMQLVCDAITAGLERAWGCSVRVHRTTPVITVAENYGQLGYPADAPSREARYTRYLDQRRLLRSHMTAAVPEALRGQLRDDDGDVTVACPGLVYRRDVVDRLHVGEPHQLDLWRVRPGTPRLGTADLEQMIGLVCHAVLPACEYRLLPAEHPYTREGREVEVRVDDRWVELLECGLAGDHVLAAGGLDAGEWSGLALGIGLDRALMLRKGIADIRLLRSDDPRVAGQMLDLGPYRPVSAMPHTIRDLSLAVRADLTAEELGDRVRSALTDQELDAVETVEVRSQTPACELPAAAIARIGLQPGQKNVLVRLEIRHPTRTLTADEANRLRDRVYAAVHEGAVHQWAAG